MNRMHLKKKRKYLKFIIIFLGLLFIYYLLINKQYNENSKYINNMMQNSLFFNDGNKIKNHLGIKYPVLIVDKAFAYNDNKSYTSFKYMHNEELKPKVYIYNTHPLESYLGEKKYNTNNTVVLAANLLKKSLDDMNINTLVEKQSATDYLKKYNLNYDESYKATRYFLNQQLKNQDFDLIIDLHRDALPRNLSTVTINNKKYAKVMFVQNVNYENYNLALKLNNIINKKYPNLSRGMYKLKVSKLNQDINKKVILIELGGNNNYFNEVENTIEALSNCIGDLLSE